MRTWFIIFINLFSYPLFAQTASSDFSVPAGVCLSELVRPDNTSIGEVNYEWDLCSGDLDETPTASNFLSTSGSPFKVELIEQNGQYFGFYTSRSNGRLYRLDFGIDVNSYPLPIDLGGLGINSNSWFTIEIIKESGIYYGFIIDLTNRLYRFSFGNDITNQPSSAEIVYQNNLLSSPVDLVILEDNGMKHAFIANIGNNRMVRLSFQNSFSEPVNSIIAIDFEVAGSGGLSGISFMKDMNVWYAITTSFGSGKIAKLKFNNGLNDNSPSVSLLSGLPFTPEVPAGVSLAFENNKFYAFVQSVKTVSNLYKIEFGSTLDNPPNSNSADLGSLNILTNIWGFAMYKVKSKWLVLSSVNGGQNIFRINFPNRCFSDKEYTNEFEPTLISRNSGDYTISLTTKDENGFWYNSFKNIRVNDKISSDIDFNNQNICVEKDVNFFPVSQLGKINTYTWDFGDLSASNSQNPTHQYASSGRYLVSLNITTDNGCHNSIEQIVQIFDRPIALFNLPSELICTNNEFTFSNSTFDNFDGNLTYAWFVNDELKAASRDFNYAFSSEGDQQIKLRTTIPGCSNENTKTLLNVQTGPVVGFSFTGKCENELIRFTNQSSGSISSFQWNFGNGNFSTIENPTEAYASHGNYSVSLNTTGTNGCVSTITKPVTIYTVPQTNFALDLPPFSCTGSPSQFNDLTPAMSDSNITSWAWAFGDQANGTSSQKNPPYTYSLAGNYLASLTTTSNFGCSNSIQKSITIYPSPKADFSFKNACVDQRTEFTDLSTGDIKSWVWTIQSSAYSVKNPIHIFKSASNYTALLTITGTNNCISQISKTITVPVPVVVDFTATSTCADKPTEFKAATISGLDLPVAWSWDFGDQGNGSGNNVTHTYAATGSYAVKLNATRQSGCTYSVTNSVDIVEPPKANFTVFLQSGPLPFSVDLTNLSSQATQYVWKPGDPKQANTSAYSPSFTYTELGDYLIELEATNDASGCRDNMQQLIHVVIPKMNAAVSDFKLNKILGSDQWRSVVTIENKSNVALIDPEVYLDISGNAKISEKVVGVIKPNGSLTHTFNAMIVPRSVDFACAEVRIDSDTNLFDNRACVNVAEQTISISPYPNPAYDELILEWVTITNAPMEVTIYQATGQAIFSRQYAPTLAGLNQAKLDVSTLPNGIYFVTYSVNGQAQNFKFSVAR